jgi:hypothetical protein
LLHVGFDTLDLIAEELRARSELFGREQSQILSDLVRDFFLRFVVIVDRRHLRLLPQKSSRRCRGCHIAKPRLNKTIPVRK